MSTHASTPGARLADAPARRPMHAVKVVVAKEWADLRLDARWRMLLAVTLALMLAALALGLQHAHRLAHAHTQAEAGDRAVWTAQGAKHPHSAAHFGQYAYKPVGPLAVAEPGVDAYVGRAVWLEAHRQNETQFRAARDGSLAARMGQLNLAFVLQTVLPLMAVLLGHAAWAAEREQGTLRQLLSLGTRPLHLMLGKALAASTLLLALLMLAGAGVAAGLWWGGDGLVFNADQALRLSGMVLGHGLYLLGFLLLALAVSAAVPNPRLALVGLLAFWLLNSFLVPRWVTEAVRVNDPLPTLAAFRAAIAEDKKRQFGHDEKHPAFIAFRERVLRQYGVARVEDLPVSFRGLSMREDDEVGYRIFDQHVGRLQAQVQAQDQRRAAAGWAFPLLALQAVSMAMAGTDNRHQHHFVNAAEQHRRRIQTATSQDLIDNARTGDSAYTATPDLWRRIPAFSYQPPTAAWAWQQQGRNLTALLLWAGLCAGAAALAAQRLRPV